ncbi:MAG TPA: hypothetical protein PKA10_09750 [Selenomonadales bacterium]|nr:hypothetical protein [Selenomonadales bacterium]
MKEKIRNLVIWLVASLFFQGLVYLYLDQFLLAPASAYEVSAVAGPTGGGKAYYSRDRRYTAVVKHEAVEIYAARKKEPVRTISLRGKTVTYFKWLEDRDLALMGMAEETSGSGRVILAQIHPQGAVHELAETIGDLPKGSRITNVAYSTATNVIYMAIQVAANPEQYRVYRTDANHDLKRVYLNASRIGRMAVLYEEDWLVYDDLAKGTVVIRHGDGSWDIVSPPAGKYRLIGVDAQDTIYIARLNGEGMATAVLAGKSKGKFSEERVYQTPRDIQQITVKELGKTVRQ